jgi:hypothetical protein
MTGKDGISLSIVDWFGRWRRFWRLESRADAGELGGAAEALRQNMEQKATDELVGVECHHFGFVVGAKVLAQAQDTGHPLAATHRAPPDRPFCSLGLAV